MLSGSQQTEEEKLDKVNEFQKKLLEANWKHFVVVQPDGTVNTLYSDEHPEFGEKVEIRRASNVEPSKDGKGWDVVLTDHPLNGEHKGKVIARNIAKRGDALRIEAEYINFNILSKVKEEL